MKIKTHMMIARQVHSHIEKDLGISVSRKHFIFGNVKPDLMRKFKTLKHSIHDSLDFVLYEIHRHEKRRHTVKNPSVHLGMINHYLSDFFCSKHYYKNEDDSFIKHVKYENKLHKTILDTNNLWELELPYLHLADKKDATFKEIIRDLELEYLKQPPSIENDIIFALCAPIIACKFLFKQNIAEGEKLLEPAA